MVLWSAPAVHNSLSLHTRFPPPPLQVRAQQAVCLIVVWGALLAWETYGQQLVVDPETLDAGRIGYGQESADVEFLLTNAGDRTLRLLKIRTTCTCFTLGEVPGGLPPGASVAVPVRVTCSRGQYGARREKLILICDDPARPVVPLSVVWQCGYLRSVSKHAIVLDAENTKRSVEIDAVKADDGFAPGRVVTERDDLSFSWAAGVSRDAGSDLWVLSCELRQPPQFSRTDLCNVLNAAGRIVLVLSVSVEAKLWAVAEPPVVLLPANAVETTVRIHMLSAPMIPGSRPQALEVPPFVRLEDLDAEDDRTLKFRVVKAEGEASAGGCWGSLRIGYAGGPSLAVPVAALPRGVAAPRPRDAAQ